MNKNVFILIMTLCCSVDAFAQACAVGTLFSNNITCKPTLAELQGYMASTTWPWITVQYGGQFCSCAQQSVSSPVADGTDCGLPDGSVYDSATDSCIVIEPPAPPQNGCSAGQEYWYNDTCNVLPPLYDDQEQNPGFVNPVKDCVLTSTSQNTYWNCENANTTAYVPGTSNGTVNSEANQNENEVVGAKEVTRDTSSTVNSDGTVTETETVTTRDPGTGTTTQVTTTRNYDGQGNLIGSPIVGSTTYTTDDDGQGGFAAGGLSCSAPPSCGGDAIQCAILRQQWQLRCVTLPQEQQTGEGFDAQAVQTELEAVKQEYETVISTIRQEADALLSVTVTAGGAIPDRIENIKGVDVNFSLSKWTSYFAMIGSVIFAAACVLAAMIILKD